MPRGGGSSLVNASFTNGSCCPAALMMDAHRVLRTRSSHERVPQGRAKFGIGTLVPRFFSMNLQPYVDSVIEFVRTHQALAPLIIGALAFGESLAFISF